MEVSIFISTNDLQSHIDSGSVRVLDSGISVEEGHFSQRIRGSIYFNISETHDRSSTLPLEFPRLEDITQYAKKLGLKNDGSLIVIYDQSNFAFSCRAWVTLKHFGYQNVKILDGGLPKWVAEGRPTDSGKYDFVENTECRDEDYRLVVGPSPRILHEDMKDVVEKIKNNQTNVKIWDPRPLDSFNQGTVYTAIHFPVSQFFNADRTIKPKEEVREAIVNHFGNSEIITSCMRGVTACAGYVMLVYSGIENRRIYTGSYTEWKAKLST